MIYTHKFIINCSKNAHNINPLKTQFNPTCHLLALLGAHHILHVSRIRVNGVSCHLIRRLQCQLYRSQYLVPHRYSIRGYISGRYKTTDWTIVYVF